MNLSALIISSVLISGDVVRGVALYVGQTRFSDFPYHWPVQSNLEHIVRNLSGILFVC